MATTKIASVHDARHVAALLDLPEIIQLIADLDETRWTGRPGYTVRTMVGAALTKTVYALPTWTRTARLIAEHAALRKAIGGTPSHWACYRTGRATGSRPSSASTATYSPGLITAGVVLSIRSWDFRQAFRQALLASNSVGNIVSMDKQFVDHMRQHPGQRQSGASQPGTGLSGIPV
jgi:hypothetical protein